MVDNVSVAESIAASAIDADPPLLIALAKSEKSHIRAAVARNFNTPDTTLRELARDHNNSVRYWVATNECASIDTLIILAGDEDISVRRRLRHNSVTSALYKVWEDNGGFAGLSLQEFLKSIYAT